MKIVPLIQASILLILTIISCGPKEQELSIKFPVKKEASEFCMYYTWVIFYQKGELIEKDTTITNHFRIPDRADSVAIYANGFGYTLVDTSFKLVERSIQLEVDPHSYPYFDAHSQVDKDVKNGALVVYTEDYEFFLMDSIYGWLQKYGARALYRSWNQVSRDERFVYNCYAEKYQLAIDPDAYEHDFRIVDSLTYLELDQYCGKAPRADDFPILHKLEKINYNVAVHTEDLLSQHYQNGYIEEIKENDYGIDRILDSLVISADYSSVRLAEVYGYLHPDEMIEKLIPLLTDTTYVGLTNSADLIIEDRISSGDLEFYGHGGVVADDLFIVSGRANHLLHEITGSTLGQVRMNPRLDYLEQLLCRWRTYRDLI